MNRTTVVRKKGRAKRGESGEKKEYKWKVTTRGRRLQTLRRRREKKFVSVRLNTRGKKNDGKCPPTKGQGKIKFCIPARRNQKESDGDKRVKPGRCGCSAIKEEVVTRKKTILCRNKGRW